MTPTTINERRGNEIVGNFASHNSCPKRSVDGAKDLGHLLNFNGEWEKLTFTGDSGACDHVITPDAANAFKLHETASSKAGEVYRAANGSQIKTYGERRLRGVTQNGIGFNMSCQVTDVKKNPASLVKMTEEGNDIALS